MEPRITLLQVHMDEEQYYFYHFSHAFGDWTCGKLNSDSYCRNPAVCSFGPPSRLDALEFTIGPQLISNACIRIRLIDKTNGHDPEVGSTKCDGPRLSLQEIASRYVEWVYSGEVVNNEIRGDGRLRCLNAEGIQLILVEGCFITQDEIITLDSEIATIKVGRDDMVRFAACC